ncbi:MAG: PAS domain S-box protein [Candidatus Thiodiazotropha sp. 6PLUC9]
MKQRIGLTGLEWLKQFLLIFLPFAATLAIAAYLHYYTISETDRVTLKSNELLNVGLTRSILNRDLSNVISDLIFLASYIERQSIDSSSRLRKRQVEQLFYTFIREKRLYDQVRFIDNQGLEKVRVNFSNGNPILVADESLQDKSGRYYFLDAMALSPGGIYISPLDLNIEEGAIEQPLKPVMRFAVPIFVDNEQIQGILVLNYLGDRLLSDFARAGANIADHIHLLNKDGYWLNSPRASDEWGFMLPHNKKFSDLYPSTWAHVSSSVSGQVVTDEGLITYETVTPRTVASQIMHGSESQQLSMPLDELRWKVVSRVPLKRFAPGFWGFIKQHIPLYFIITVVLLFGSWLLASANLRHRYAQRQSEYERRFRRTLEDMQLAAITLDNEYRLVFCNDYFLKMTGWSRQDVLHDEWIERFVRVEHRQRFLQTLKRLRSEQTELRDIEVDVVMKYGGHRRIAWHQTPSTDSGGRIIGVTAIGEDVTERRKAEEKVRMLSHAVEQSPSIVMLTDRYGQIEYVNPKFSQVTGYSAGEVVGKKTNILKSGETDGDQYQQLWQTVLNGKEWRGEFHNRRKNGELYWESASISSLKNSKGEITNFVAVKEDITEHKRLEREVELQHQELVRTQALTVLGQMASMIAHDLRNPLSSVKMCMQLLGKQSSNDEKELSTIGLDQIRYMENILTDMLTFARPEAVNVEWINIEKLVDATLISLHKRIEEAQATIQVDYQSGLPALPGDANKLRQLFSNLIVNALQASESSANGSSDIRIKVFHVMGETGGAIEVSVCDNGIGIPAQDREKLFEPFYTTRTKGTGLGLAIVKQIIEQHQGVVELVPGEVKGSCAIVTLPTTPRDEEQLH